MAEVKIRILGAGWYGCHLADYLSLHYNVELHEVRGEFFGGASGSNPARLHLGLHYPRSAATREACRAHHGAFIQQYGHLTRGVPTNLYAVAAEESWLDFATYCKVLSGEVDCIVVEPSTYGLVNVEGVVACAERHVVIAQARDYFTQRLHAQFRMVERGSGIERDHDYDLTVDCTFCANDEVGVDRYEACVTGILEGPEDTAVTVMDGPFPSIYPWNEDLHLSSLTSAKFTPLKRCVTHAEAQTVIDTIGKRVVERQCAEMIEQVAKYWPASRDRYKLVDAKLGVRAMPKSGADARVVDVVQVGPKRLRVRAGKIDAIFSAQAQVNAWLLKNVLEGLEG